MGFDPITATFLTLAGSASSLVGTGISAYGSYQAGKQQKAAADYNAKMNEMEADRALDVGIENTKRKRQDNQRRLASYRASFASSGVSSSGSYTDFMSDSASQLEMQALDVFNQAQNQAASFRNQAASQRYSGAAAKSAGAIGAAGTLIGGVADTIYKRANFKYNENG